MGPQVYLFFEGRTEEALNFYKEALGAEVTMLSRFGDSPDPNSCAPGDKDKIMHANFTVGDVQLMASDGRCSGTPNFDGFALSLTPKDKAEAERLFGVLGEGGAVAMPLTETFWSPAFGMLKDQFGVHWMINVEPPEGWHA